MSDGWKLQFDQAIKPVDIYRVMFFKPLLLDPRTRRELRRIIYFGRGYDPDSGPTRPIAIIKSGRARSRLAVDCEICDSSEKNIADFAKADLASSLRVAQARPGWDKCQRTTLRGLIELIRPAVFYSIPRAVLEQVLPEIDFSHAPLTEDGLLYQRPDRTTQPRRHAVAEPTITELVQDNAQWGLF